MQKTSRPALLFVLTLLLFSLVGCGSNSPSPSFSSSPGPDPSPDPGPDTTLTVRVSGIIEDGPIENSKISLRDNNETVLSLCGPQGTSRCEIASDAAGTFSLDVPVGTDFSSLVIHSIDGTDRSTGVDFTGLQMCSPLALFTNDVTAIVVSPLTTLVAELQEQGLSLADAQNRLRVWLALPPGTNLAARPSASLDLQSRTLLLTVIILKLDDEQPFGRMSTEIVKSGTALFAHDGSYQEESLSALGLSEEEIAQIMTLQQLLAAATTIDDLALIYKQSELMAIFSANIEKMLIDSTAFDPQNADYLENLRILVDTTLRAAGSEVITLGGTIPQRIARYILFTYELRTWESLTVDAVTFAATLKSLESDLWIAELARSRSLYSVVSPLLLTELPGNDNQQRLAYFYGSDLSPYFQAEQLLGLVFDDAINDAVLLKIVEGKADAGLIDEVRTLIATQIVQSESKAHAYRALADALIQYNRTEEAVAALDLARDLYRQVLASKGTASASSTDVDNLVATSSSYRKAGDLENAELLLTQDIAEIATALSTDTTSYGKLITGIKNVVDDYLDAGDLTAAASLVETMYYYSDRTPQDKGKTTYKLRIYNWSECAKRYADLNNQAKVLEISSKVEMQRDADSATATGTWVYLPDLVESLYRVGATGEALALAATIPNDATYLTYLSKAYKLVATYEALQGNLQKAFEIVDNSSYFTEDEERIELLTYFNDTRPYIAQMLIDEGRFSEARQALEKAEGLLAGMTTSDNLVRISNGYVKVAALYALMGDKPKATAVLQSAEATIIEDLYRVRAMLDTALGYHNLDQTAVALNLLAGAQSLAEADLSAYYRADTTANLGTAEAKALLYEKLVLAYEEMGEKSRTYAAVQLFLASAQQIHPSGTVDDSLAGKECDYLLRAALYLETAGYHADAVIALTAAKASSDQIAVVATRLEKYLSVIATYAAVHEYDQALSLALSVEYTTERNQAIQSLANDYIDRDDFPESLVASIDSDGDGKPDFFHPLASTAEITASALFLDDDSDGDGIVDSLDLRPLFAD